MISMDALRGAYVRSPRFLRNILAPVVSLVPTGLKFGHNYRHWRTRIRRAAADPVYADAEHRAALRALLAKAHAGSPFYRDLIEAAFGPGFDAGALCLADLERLPVLGKQQISAERERALAVPRGHVDVGQTAGSNAEKPFSFYLDRDRSAREMAFVYDVWARVGFSERESRAALRGFNLDPRGSRLQEWDPALRELRLSVFPMSAEDVALYLDYIDRRRIRYIYGYASAIELFCRHLRTLGRLPRLPILGILPVSEPLFDHQRSFIRSVLGDAPFACFYGLSEKVLFAAEVPGEEGTYEFNPLYGLAELVDGDGNRITEIGREGRVVGTGFLSTGMPFIRYDTGDFARLAALPTAENGQRLRVTHLTPRRKPGFLIAADGSRVVTTAMTSLSERLFRGIAEFQLYQDRPGHVVVRYILAPGGCHSDAARLAADLQASSRKYLHYTIHEVDQIASGRSGKRAFIDQRLDFLNY
jgi:phenylacetate-CoA ligase